MHYLLQFAFNFCVQSNFVALLCGESNVCQQYNAKSEPKRHNKSLTTIRKRYFCPFDSE